MKKYIIFLFIFLGLSGCSPYKYSPYVTYWPNNAIESCLGIDNDHSIYDFISPAIGRADNEYRIPALYQIHIPHKKNMKRVYSNTRDICFIYSKSRGIAIIQNLDDWKGNNENGFKEIEKETVENLLRRFENANMTEIKVKDKKQHYMYVDNEIRIIMFNLTNEDYHNFVELPMKSFKIKRRGEIRIDNNKER